MNFTGYDTSIIYKLIPVDTMPKPPVIVGDSIKTFGTLAVDSSYGIYVSATGTEHIICKWYKNNTLIPNATNDTFSFPKLVFADTGNYYCIATNNWGSDTSLSMSITLVPKYTVAYNGNGNTAGTVPVDTNNYISGTTVSVKNNFGLLVKAGYTFSGWNTKKDGTGTAYAVGSSFNIGSADILLYVKWTTNQTFSVTYDSNGSTSGSVPSDDNNYETGALATVKNNSGLLTKTGYIFFGWNTTGDGSGTAYPTGSGLTIGSANIILYASWNSYSYTVTFDDLNATTLPNPTTIKINSPATTVGTLPTSIAKTGYIFDGWFTASGAEFIATTIVTSDIVVFAKWNNYSYIVSFEDQGAIIPPNPTNKTVSSPTTTVVTLPSAPEKTGYTFNGWFMLVNGGGTEFIATTIVTKNITVYAKWTIIQYAVNFNSQGGSEIETKQINHGNLVTPTTTTLTSYVFDGWYTESTCVTLWNFTVNQITSDITLYAKWIIKDIDGNVYTEVTIGTQTWMVENLKTT